MPPKNEKQESEVSRVFDSVNKARGYEGFGHPISKPREWRAVAQENWNWFADYIWGGGLPADLKSVLK